MDKPEERRASSKKKEDLSDIELISDKNYEAPNDVTSSPSRALCNGICYQHRFDAHLL